MGGLNSTNNARAFIQIYESDNVWAFIFESTRGVSDNRVRVYFTESAKDSLID